MSFEQQGTAAEYTKAYAQHRQYDSEYQQMFVQAHSQPNVPTQFVYMQQNGSAPQVAMTMEPGMIIDQAMNSMAGPPQPMYAISGQNQSHESFHSYAENISEDLFSKIMSQVPDEQITAALNQQYDQTLQEHDAGHGVPSSQDSSDEPITLENLLEDDPLLYFTTTLDRQRSNDTIIETSSPINPPSEPSPVSHNGSRMMMNHGNTSVVSLQEEPSLQSVMSIPNTLPTPASSTTSGNHSSPNLVQPNYTVAPPHQQMPMHMPQQMRFSPPQQHHQQPVQQAVQQITPQSQQTPPMPKKQPKQQQKKNPAPITLQQGQHQFQATTQTRMHQAMLQQREQRLIHQAHVQAQQQQQQQQQQSDARAMQQVQFQHQSSIQAHAQAQFQAQAHAQAQAAAQAAANAHAQSTMQVRVFQQGQGQAQAAAQAAQAHVQPQTPFVAQQVSPYQLEPQQHIFHVCPHQPVISPQHPQQVSPARSQHGMVHSASDSHLGMDIPQSVGSSQIRPQRQPPHQQQAFPPVPTHVETSAVPATPTPVQPPMMKSKSTTKLPRAKKNSVSSGSSSSKVHVNLRKSKSFVQSPMVTKQPSKAPLYQTLDFSKQITKPITTDTLKIARQPTQMTMGRTYEFVFEQGDGKATPRRTSLTTPTSAKFPFAKPPPIEGGGFYSPKSSPTNSEASGHSPLTFTGSSLTQPSPVPSSIHRFSPTDSGWQSPTVETFSGKRKGSSPDKSVMTPPSSLKNVKPPLEFRVVKK